MNALARIQRLSSIAAQEAGLVLDSALAPDGEPLRLGDGFFVPRRVVEETKKLLDGPSALRLVLLVGEAGHGKTSALWALHQHFMDRGRWAPLFIKASSLRRGFQGEYALSVVCREDLLGAVRALRSEGRTPVLFLDTLDSIVGSEGERESLLLLLEELLEADARVVATSRPQEAAELDVLRWSRRGIGPYDEGTEFPVAVRRHVERFYVAGGKVDAEQEIERILHAVAQGRPLREVCLSPLLLRMLFAVYAPHAIPEEIHVARLYLDFWTSRVVRDRRAGETRREGGRDLADVAGTVALAMLAEGSPELPRTRVDAWLAQAGVSSEEVDTLISRRVLAASEDATVRFFHQTFFEHSAAQGLLMRAGEQAFDLVVRRQRHRRGDVFLAPVVEQLLLVAEEGTPGVARRADETLAELLADPHPVEWRVGTYVYAYRRRVPDSVAERVRAIVAQGREELADTLVRSLPSVSSTRLPEMLALVSSLWQVGSWRVRRHVLESLVPIAGRAPDGVRRFLSRHQVRRLVLEQPSDAGGDRLLLLLYARLAHDLPLWIFEQFVEFYLESDGRSAGADLHAAIVETLAGVADAFEFRDIARRFHARVAPVHTGQTKVARKLAEAHSGLWLVEWHARGLNVEEILHELPGGDAVGMKARLNALADVLVGADLLAFDAARRHYDGLSDPATAWQWVHIVWARLVRGEPSRVARRLPATSHASDEVVAAARGWCEQTISLEESVGDDSAREDTLEDRRRAARAIVEAELPVDISAPLLTRIGPEEPTEWIEDPVFVSLLASACVAAVPGALHAAQWAARQSDRRRRRTAENVADRLGAEALRRPTLAVPAANLAVVLNRPEGFNAALDEWEVSDEKIRIEPKVLQRLDGLIRGTVGHLSGSRRRQAARLWLQLVRRGVMAPPAGRQVRWLLAGEEDPPTRGWLASLLGLAAVHDYGTAPDAVATLEELAKDATTRSRAAGAMVDVAVAHIFDEGLLDKVVTVCTRSPLDVGTVGALGRPLERLVESSPLRAAALLHRTLVSMEGLNSDSGGLGPAGRRTLAARWRGPVRHLFQQAPPPELEGLLSLVPRLDRHLGRLLVDAACVQAFAALRERLDRLLEDPRVSDVLKNLIRGHKTHRERRTDADRWDDIIALLDARVRDAHTGRASAKRAFVSYAHADGVGLGRLKLALKNLERQGLLTAWTDREILAGQRWDEAIRSELENAELVLFLVSPDLVASDYVHDVELRRALEKRDSGDATVVPIIYRACDWGHTQLSQFQALPTGGKPIQSAGDVDAAWQDVTDGLRMVLRSGQ